MSDDWDFYFCRVNDELASIFVDLGVHGEAPDATRPELLFAWIEMRAPRPDGLSSDEESETLFAMEDALSRAAGAACGATLVGRVTNAGRRELYFYASRAEGFDVAIERAIGEFPGYRADTGAKHDPEWGQYLGLLYPGPRQLQQIMNRRVRQALSEAGDALTAARPVRHWLYFASESDRDDVARRLREDGFEVESTTTADQAGARPHGLSAEREDRVEAGAIDELTFAMLALVEGRDADYDGWEAQVVAEG